MKTKMNEAVAYHKGALCATMIGERLHPQRRPGQATTYDDVLLRTPVPCLGDDENDRWLSGESMASRAFFSSSSFTTAHSTPHKTKPVVYPKSGVRFINMMSRKLHCATLLIKWVLKLKKKDRPDMYRIIKACDFKYDYDGEGHHRHMTTTLLVNPNMAGVWYTSTRQLYDDLMVRMKNAREREATAAARQLQAAQEREARALAEEKEKRRDLKSCEFYT